MPWIPASFRTTGRHALGTTRLRLRARAEDGSTETRQVRLWYPVDAAKPTLTEKLTQVFRRLMHSRLAPAWHGARLARTLGRLPLITYVHDIAGSHEENSRLLANIASHGFVMAAMEAPFGDSAVPGGAAGAERRSREAEMTSTQRGVRNASQLLDALQQLERVDKAAWGNRIDLENVGILGYGLGGSVAAEATNADKRYVAAGNLGGPLGARIVTAPYLAMLGDFPTPDAPAAPRSLSNARETLHLWRARHQARLPKGHVMQIEGARKESFGGQDAQLVGARWPAAQQPPAQVNRLATIIEAYTVAFFATYLQNHQHPLMCVRHSPYAEVRFLAAFPQRRMHRAPTRRQ